MRLIYHLYLLLFYSALALAQEPIDEVTIDEIVVSSHTDKTIIKKSALNLPKKGKRLKGVYIGQGQHTQIIESKNRAIQLSRYYGSYTTSGGKRTIGPYPNMDFRPYYNACSLRLNSEGDKELETSHLAFTYGTNDDSQRLSFNSYKKYIFEIMSCIYLYGPLFSENVNDYNYKLEEINESVYTYSFEPSSRYPKNNGLYATGNLIIDIETFKLKSILINRMGLSNVMSTISNNRVLTNKEQNDCIDCRFDIDDNGQICYALVHIPWNSSTKQRLSPQPRSKASENNHLVTECWKTESCTYLTKSDIRHLYGSLMSIFNLDSNSTTSIPANVLLKYQEDSLSTTIKYPNATTPCIYNDNVIKSIKWALDVSKAEEQLCRFQPINEQYKKQSGVSFTTPKDLIPSHYISSHNNSTKSHYTNDTIIITIQESNQEQLKSFERLIEKYFGQHSPTPHRSTNN